MSPPLAAVWHILFFKNQGDTIETTLDEVYQLFIDYGLELAFKEARRTVPMKSVPATVDSILTQARRNLLHRLGNS